MFRRGLMVALAAGACSTAGADVIVFTQYDVWSGFVSAMGETVATETFAGYNGFYPGDVSGSAGGIAWTASATGGLYADAGFFSTNLANTELFFALSPGVNGVGGNFFATDVSFNVIPSIVEVFLSDGTSYIASITSADAFVGFYSTDAAITSISTLALSTSGGPPAYATANNLYFAVPAPGAVALLAAAGVVARRRRRD